MLYIDKNSPEIINATKNHFGFYQCRILKKITGVKCFDKTCPVCSSTKIHQFKSNRIDAEKIKLFIKNNLNNLIIGSPQMLNNTNNIFFTNILSINELQLLSIYFTSDKSKKKKLQFRKIHRLIHDISSIFDYDYFISLEPTFIYSAYHLAENLNRRSCTYCNRNYTTTIITKNKGKLMRPEFDHWFPKSKYPLLSISFYNLIPSCYICNSSVKGDLEFNLTNNTHPYIDINQTEDFVFNYFYSSKLNKYRIFIQSQNPNNQKAFKTIKELKIDEMYNTHYEELNDLIKIKQTYSDSYIQTIKKLFPKQSLTNNEIYRLLFGTEMDSVDFHKRPLSKFKKDILIKLNILK